MKKLWLPLVAGVLLTACGGGDGTKPDGAKPPETAAANPAAGLKIGDTAVHKSSKQGYVEGKIQKIDGARYEIKYGESLHKVESADVHPLPKPGEKVSVQPGDYVVVHQREAYWPG